MSAILQAEGLHFSYGAVIAARDVSLRVEEGEIVTLVGANGAGKSTMLRGIAGILRPSAGRVVFAGRDITRLASHERCKAGIALVPEGRHVFPYLTVLENLEVGGYTYRRDKAKLKRLIEHKMEMFPRLRERATQRAGTLSGGEQQMLALSRALMSEPRLLCLDEPSLGLAPIVVQEIFRSILRINAEGTSVLLVEQNTRYAMDTAQRGYVLRNGAVIAEGTCAELRDDPRLHSAYLGNQREAAVAAL
ncbi:MAG: ABC transporter ATP-binding protein [Alcaligenaceae bacterium]|nr:ABC transporter ATP-binding protein [Alcaligenaceae bacterium SAGV5]MPS53161.1 ABC transporter ATP-binding protein [Alcaligenaceae bacterium SAGV3]MPT55401.1 ABC transporter ATP-binding protein [Alcaligenaceae bacterium]